MALKAVKRFLLYRKVRLVRSKNRGAILSPAFIREKNISSYEALAMVLSEYILTARNVQS